MEIERTLDLTALLKKKSHFLFGPRGTGKTSLIRASLKPEVPYFDLLSDDIYSRLLRRPAALAEMVPASAQLVVIDEIQKVPALLDEVHRLIESRKMRFLLTGSSARKLRRGGANLLGGRAWEANLFPVTSHELGTEFDLPRYLTRGGLPAFYRSDYPEEELKNYVKLYIREEIQSESLVKRLDHFVRFLDVAALASGQEQNFESVASDSGVPARTVASYFEILEDTLVGFQVKPFGRTRKRKAIKRSKFYLFDVGVAGALVQRGTVNIGAQSFGPAFEHFIAQELRAYIHYRNLNTELMYWRSTTQQEVDFIIGDKTAIEVKTTERVSERQLGGLQALQEEKLIDRYLVVSRDPLRRTVGSIEIMPWHTFLEELWQDKIVH